MKINKVDLSPLILLISVCYVLVCCAYGACDGCSLDRNLSNSSYNSTYPVVRNCTRYVTNVEIPPDPFDELGEGNLTPGIVLGIVSPMGYPQMYQEGPIKFEAFVFSGAPPYSFEWVSDMAGIIGRNNKFTKNDLSVNTHNIVLTVRDSAGFKATDSISLKVIAKIPLTASIISPKNATYAGGSNITLTPSFYGGRKPHTIIWRLDGTELGGRNIKCIDNISFGIHEITLEVTDSDAVSVGDRVKITVVEICDNNSVCDPGENYLNCPQDCSGSTDNYCDGIRDGICDLDCLREEDMDCMCNRDGTCEVGMENYRNCPRDCPPGSLDKYCDGVEDGICDPDCIEGEDHDCMGDGWFNYMILLILAFFLMAVYLKFIKR